MLTSRRSVLLMAAASSLAAAKKSNEYWMYFGTYTRKTSKGIYVSRLDVRTGAMSEPVLAGEVGSPSFVAIHPTEKYLYSVSEQGGGAVTSFSIDKATGKLTQLNVVSSKGGGPCHLNVDKTGKTLVVVNYGTGSTAAMAVNADGSLAESTSYIQHKGSSVDERRQKGPHAHSVNISPDNRFAMVADLGLDQVLVFKLDPANATIAPNDPPFVSVKPGSGPRHFAFHPSGKYAYAINEMGNTVTSFRYDAARGVLTEISTVSTLPPDWKAVSHTAEVVVHPNGKFLYGSNRGHDSIAVMKIDPKTGGVTLLENTSTQGKTPRNFNIDPTGKYLFAANQDTDNVVQFSINPGTGKLTPTGKQLKVGIPVCIRFVSL